MGMDFEVSNSNYIQENLMSIRNELMRSVALNYSQELRNDPGFSNFLNSAIQGVTDNMSVSSEEVESKPAFMDISSPTTPMNMSINNPAQTPIPATINQAIDNYSNIKQLTGNEKSGDLSNQYSYTSKRNHINSVNGETISDEMFYNGNSLLPHQIDSILKAKNSPFADRTYSDGRTAGQLIYDVCNKAGTEQSGPKKINPALILSIMGAESNFGKDPNNEPENPFNIRIGGRFDLINNFEDSLRVAVNTMYNWAQAKPKDSNVTLFDYSGNKYCEDYTKVWKPNVESFYKEFTNLT